jgi:hypothetical protein
MMPGRCWLAFADEDTIEMQNECTPQALVLKREVRGPQRRKYGAFTRHDCRETAINRGGKPQPFKLNTRVRSRLIQMFFHRSMAARSKRPDHDPGP